MASLNGAIDIILGKMPLHSKFANRKTHLLGGKEAYRRLFKIHKSVCHLIAALETLRQEKGIEKLSHKELSSFTSEDIERFLSLSHWFRKKLLDLQTRNVKNKTFFTEDSLIPLPSWVDSEHIDLPLALYKEKIEEIFEPLLAEWRKVPLKRVLLKRKLA